MYMGKTFMCSDNLVHVRTKPLNEGFFDSHPCDGN